MVARAGTSDASRRDLGAVSARSRVTYAQGTWLDAVHLRDLPGATPEVRPHTHRALAARPSTRSYPIVPSHHPPQVLRILEKRGIAHLAQLIHAPVESLRGWLRGAMRPADLNALVNVARSLPDVRCTVSANSAEYSPGADGCVTVELVSGQRGRRHAFAPRFPKPRPEGGW